MLSAMQSERQEMALLWNLTIGMSYVMDDGEAHEENYVLKNENPCCHVRGDPSVEDQRH